MGIFITKNSLRSDYGISFLPIANKSWFFPYRTTNICGLNKCVFFVIFMNNISVYRKRHKLGINNFTEPKKLLRNIFKIILKRSPKKYNFLRMWYLHFMYARWYLIRKNFYFMHIFVRYYFFINMKMMNAKLCFCFSPIRMFFK